MQLSSLPAPCIRHVAEGAFVGKGSCSVTVTCAGLGWIRVQLIIRSGMKTRYNDWGILLGMTCSQFGSGLECFSVFVWFCFNNTSHREVLQNTFP